MSKNFNLVLKWILSADLCTLLSGNVQDLTTLSKFVSFCQRQVSKKVKKQILLVQKLPFICSKTHYTINSTKYTNFYKMIEVYKMIAWQSETISRCFIIMHYFCYHFLTKTYPLISSYYVLLRKFIRTNSPKAGHYSSSHSGLKFFWLTSNEIFTIFWNW